MVDTACVGPNAESFLEMQDLDSIWRAHFANAGFFYSGDGYHEGTYQSHSYQQETGGFDSQSRNSRESENTRARWDQRSSWQGAFQQCYLSIVYSD
jgi:hypothetical protein